MYAALCMQTYAQKKKFLGKDDLTIVEGWEEMYLKECTLPKLTQP